MSGFVPAFAFIRAIGDAFINMGVQKRKTPPSPSNSASFQTIVSGALCGVQLGV
jgi:hypothetical protein